MDRVNSPLITVIQFISLTFSSKVSLSNLVDSFSSKYIATIYLLLLNSIKVFKNSVLLSQKKNFNFFDNLFEFRSRTLLSKKKYYPKSELIAYLIGNEIKSNINNTKATKVIIIGSKYNSKLYSQAMQVLKIKNTIVDSKDITIAGLKTLINKFVK